MNSFQTLSLKWNEEELWVLDQTQLPSREVWLEMTSLAVFISAIKNLSIRGAPLIGVSSALFLAKLARKEKNKVALLNAATEIRQARPTAVNLMVCIDRMVQTIKISTSYNDIIAEAKKIFYEDQKLCFDIAKNGSEYVSDGDSIITHCNTGALATAGIGTALGILRYSKEVQNKKIHVFIDETRPLLQGARLTAWELTKLEIPFTLITDSMAAFLMRQKKINKAFVGCDRIALNGDFANKIGTYSLAVNCYHHQIPFYVSGPYTTIDFNCKSGIEIPIEERAPEEVQGFVSNQNKIVWSPPGAAVYNPSFDVTPAELVTAWILDIKSFNKESISTLTEFKNRGN